VTTDLRRFVEWTDGAPYVPVELLLPGEVIHLYRCQGLTVPAIISALHPILRCFVPTVKCVAEHFAPAYASSIKSATQAVAAALSQRSGERADLPAGVTAADTASGALAHHTDRTGVAATAGSALVGVSGDHFIEVTAEEVVAAHQDRVAAWPWESASGIGRCRACGSAFDWSEPTRGCPMPRRAYVHHCAQCGRVVCGPCSSARAVVRGLGHELKRVCDVCRFGGPSVVLQ